MVWAFEDGFDVERVGAVWVDVGESGRADVGEDAVVEVVAFVSMGGDGVAEVGVTVFFGPARKRGLGGVKSLEWG